jgi:predicted CopG family antitoxin
MSITKRTFNIRIAVESWEKIRWAKLKIPCKSYSEVILSLNNNLPNTIKQKELITYYLKFRQNLSKSYKTIMVEKEAHKTLEKIKLLSGDSSFTLSDAVYFLIFVSSL